MRNRWIVALCVSVVSALGGCQTSERVGSRSEPSLEARLEHDVRVLSELFRDRNADNRLVLNDSGAWIEEQFRMLGYSTSREAVPTAGEPGGFNVIAELIGTTNPDEIIVVGAHYDAVPGSPGADDNASGVAVLLELAARFVNDPQPRTIRWVAFTNEENPSSAGGQMGSATHALGCAGRGERVAAMISLEMLGYYDDTPGSQSYPFQREMGERLGMTLPDRADFVGIVGRLEDSALVATIGGAMRDAGTVSVVEAPLPAMIPDIWRSDHGPFWAQGFNAVMITDTSEFRTPHYHGPHDTAETLDYERMAGAARACESAVRALAAPAD